MNAAVIAATGLFTPAERVTNAELVEAGLAETLTIPPNDRFAGRFARLEDRAKAARLGIWGDG